MIKQYIKYLPTIIVLLNPLISKKYVNVFYGACFFCYFYSLVIDNIPGSNICLYELLVLITSEITYLISTRY